MKHGTFTGREYVPDPQMVNATVAPGAFIPVATMFKLTGPDSDVVSCVACGAVFPREDLRDSELEEDNCPRCGVTAVEFWAGRPCQEKEIHVG